MSGLRRSTSDKYRMEITALEDCPKCLGTGIAMVQTPRAIFSKIDIELSVCMCVRVMPRLVHDPHARPDVFAKETA